MYPLPQRTKSRTISSIANDLNATTPNTKKLGDHFLNCRYDPFNPTPVKSYVPDGKGKNVVVRDIKLAHNLVVASGDTLNMQIMPFLPYPVRFSSPGWLTTAGVPGTSTVDGAVLGGNTAGNLPNPAAVNYVGMVPPNILQSTIPFPAGSETSAIMGARIVTIGYRLYYTGQASSAQGTIVATDFSWSIDTTDSANNQILYQVTSTPAAVALVADTAAVNTTPLMSVQTPIMNGMMPNTTQIVLRPENGLRGVLKYQRTADNHVFQPWYENGIVPVMLMNGTVETPIFVRNAAYWGGAAGMIELWTADPALMGTHIALTGAGSYRLELAICYEQDLSPNNSLIDMARPSPLIDRPLLDADDYLNSGVHAAPLNGPILTLQQGMGSMSLRRRPGRRRKRAAKKQQPTPKCPQPANSGRGNNRGGNSKSCSCKKK